MSTQLGLHNQLGYITKSLIISYFMLYGHTTHPLGLIWVPSGPPYFFQIRRLRLTSGLSVGPKWFWTGQNVLECTLTLKFLRLIIIKVYLPYNLEK